MSRLQQAPLIQDYMDCVWVSIIKYPDSSYFYHEQEYQKYLFDLSAYDISVILTHPSKQQLAVQVIQSVYKCGYPVTMHLLNRRLLAGFALTSLQINRKVKPNLAQYK